MARNSRKRRSNKKVSPKLSRIIKKKIQKTANIPTAGPVNHNTRVLRSRNSKINPNTIKAIINNRKVNYTPGRTDTVHNIRITCDLSKDKVQSNPLQRHNDNNILVSKTATATVNNKSLTDLYKTIDCAEESNANNDVILINDADDSDVICVETNKESSRLSKRFRSEESVILIDDDSIIEIPSTPATDTLPVLSPIINCKDIQPTTSKIKKPVTSTPACSRRYSRRCMPWIFQNIANIELGQGPNSSNKTNSHYNFAKYTPKANTKTQKELDDSVNNLNKFGLNFLNGSAIRTNGLRPIFIDGSNIAMGHTNGRFFSVRGLKICIDYFKLRGHEVTAIVPMFRKNKGQNSDPKLLYSLEKDAVVIFTPSRTINGRHIVPYDDRYIVLLAHVHKGVIVSSDNYRDLLQENPNLLDTIENRVLNPTWVKDMIIFPSDPMGRNGPKLDEFLRFPE